MGDEYTEQKVRVYQPQKKKNENILTKVMIKPMQKFMGLDKSKDTKKNRLTA